MEPTDARDTRSHFLLVFSILGAKESNECVLLNINPLLEEGIADHPIDDETDGVYQQDLTAQGPEEPAQV